MAGASIDDEGDDLLGLVNMGEGIFNVSISRARDDGGTLVLADTSSPQELVSDYVDDAETSDIVLLSQMGNPGSMSRKEAARNAVKCKMQQLLKRKSAEFDHYKTTITHVLHSISCFFQWSGPRSESDWELEAYARRMHMLSNYIWP